MLRRELFVGGLLTIPAIIRAGSLMKFSIPTTPWHKPGLGFIGTRTGYQVGTSEMIGDSFVFNVVPVSIEGNAFGYRILN
jgi:hypothetical protein